MDLEEIMYGGDDNNDTSDDNDDEDCWVWMEEDCMFIFEGNEDLFDSCTYGYWYDACWYEEDDESCYAYVTYMGDEWEGTCEDLEMEFSEYITYESDYDDEWSYGDDDDCKWQEVGVNGSEIGDEDLTADTVYWVSYDECSPMDTASCNVYYMDEWQESCDWMIEDWENVSQYDFWFDMPDPRFRDIFFYMEDYTSDTTERCFSECFTEYDGTSDFEVCVDCQHNIIFCMEYYEGETFRCEDYYTLDYDNDSDDEDCEGQMTESWNCDVEDVPVCTITYGYDDCLDVEICDVTWMWNDEQMDASCDEFDDWYANGQDWGSDGEDCLWYDEGDCLDMLAEDVEGLESCYFTATWDECL